MPQKKIWDGDKKGLRLANIENKMSNIAYVGLVVWSQKIYLLEKWEVRTLRTLNEEEVGSYWHEQ